MKKSPKRLFTNKGALVTGRLCHCEVGGDALLLELVENLIKLFNLCSG